VLNTIGQKKAAPHPLAITRDTHKSYREELRSGKPVQYFNNMSHGQNLR
jgi:hypothetical protein